MALGVPILKHFRVSANNQESNQSVNFNYSLQFETVNSLDLYLMCLTRQCFDQTGLVV